MYKYSKKECELKSMEFMRKLADCNSQHKKLKDQRQCTYLIYKEFNDFVQECIIKKKYD